MSLFLNINPKEIWIALRVLHNDNWSDNASENKRIALYL